MTFVLTEETITVTDWLGFLKEALTVKALPFLSDFVLEEAISILSTPVTSYAYWIRR